MNYSRLLFESITHLSIIKIPQQHIVHIVLVSRELIILSIFNTCTQPHVFTFFHKQWSYKAYCMRTRKSNFVARCVYVSKFIFRTRHRRLVTLPVYAINFIEKVGRMKIAPARKTRETYYVIQRLVKYRRINNVTSCFKFKNDLFNILSNGCETLKTHMCLCTYIRSHFQS